MKYPRVYEHFDKRESLIWILDKDFLHQIFVVFRAIWSEFDVSSHNLSTYLELVTSERSTPMYKLIQKNSDGPHINLVIMWQLLDHLGCHILECAAEGVPLFLVASSLICLATRFYTPSEVTDL